MNDDDDLKARALCWLAARHPGLRNVLRAWLVLYLGCSQAPSRPALARQLGRHASGETSRLLARLEAAGVLLRQGSLLWSSAVLGPGLEAVALAAALGPAEEVTRGRGGHPEPRVCPKCHGVWQGEICGLCPVLRRRPPGWLERLAIYAERAMQRKPLFSPALEEPSWEESS